MDRLKRENKCTAAEARFVVTSFESNMSTLLRARASIAVESFTTELPWNRHRHCINRFLRESEMRRRTVDDQDETY